MHDSGGDSEAGARPRKKRRPRVTPGERIEAIRCAERDQRIKRVKPLADGEHWEIKLENGDAFRLGSALMTQLGLGPGVEWDNERAETAAREQAVAFARHDGLGIVSRRAITRSGLVTALLRKGHAKPDAERAAEILERVGLIDDERVAQAHARSLVRRGGVGARRIEQALRAKGVGGEAARRAATEALDGTDPMEEALAFARKKARTLVHRVEREVAERRIGAALARRGFDAGICREAAKAAVDQPDEPDAE